MKNRLKITDALKDVTFMFTELVYERENFSGHYEGGEYQAISIFGSGINVGNFDPYEYIEVDEESIPVDWHEIKILKNGAVIKILCQLASTIDFAFDSDIEPLNAVQEKHLQEIQFLNQGVFESNLFLKKCVAEANIDISSFSKLLVIAFNDLVVSHFEELINKCSGRNRL